MTMPYGAPEMMAVAMARRLRDREVVFFGVNSPLPMAAVQLARRTHAPKLVLVTVASGVDPRPEVLPSSTLSPDLMQGSASVFPQAELYDLVARGRVDAGFLGFAQIDPLGRFNSTVLGDFHRPRVRLPGGAGSSFMLPLIKRVMAWRADHSPRIFVHELDFVTATGNIDRVFTPLCVFRPGPQGLVVESIHPYTTLAEVAERTGFPLILPEEGVQVTPPPTAEELAILAEIDPNQVRTIEFK